MLVPPWHVSQLELCCRDVLDALVATIQDQSASRRNLLNGTFSAAPPSVISTWIVQAWVNQLGWLLSMRFPSFYYKRRVTVLLVVKVLMAYQTIHATNKIGDRMYDDSTFTQQAPATSFFLKLILICNVPYILAWVAGMPIPFALQSLGAALHAAVFVLGGSTRGEHRLSDTGQPGHGGGGVMCFNHTLRSACWQRLCLQCLTRALLPRFLVRLQQPGLSVAFHPALAWDMALHDALT